MTGGGALAARLPGTWRHVAGCQLSITAERDDPSRLQIKYSALPGTTGCLLPAGRQFDMTARLIEQGGHVLLDVSPRDRRQMFSPAVHSLLLVAFDGDALLLIPPSAEWLHRSPASRVSIAARLETGGLPAWSGRDISGAELQRFGLKHLHDGLFSAPPWRFTRQ